MMRTILLSSIFAFAMMSTTGCYETNSAVKTANMGMTKCSSGKCGTKEKAKSMKCGAAKCGSK